MGRQELCAENAQKIPKLVFKQKTRPQFSVLSAAIESAWAPHGWFHADSMAALKSDYCVRFFFLTPHKYRDAFIFSAIC